MTGASVRTKPIVKLTANFEQNLAEIEKFLLEVDAPQAFDTLLDELTNTVIPNLERFPAMGRQLMNRRAGSVEVSNGLDGLNQKLASIGNDGELREYVLSHFLLLYLRQRTTITLLSIRHHRQLSFDLGAHWSSP